MQIRSFFKEKINIFKSKRNWVYIGFWAFILFTFFVNTLHESYPDEFDNIMGGWYILHGRLIYTGFFTHHDPVAYFIAAFVEIFSGRSFVRFRIFYSILLFIFTFWSFSYLKGSIKRISMEFYLGVVLFFGVGATYFWGHMLLADNVSAILLMPAFALVLIKSLYKEALTLKDYIFVSVLSSLALLSSITYFYLTFGLFAFLGLSYLHSYSFNIKRVLSKETGKIILIILAPYIIFLIYLIVTGSFKDYFYDAVSFNQKYYIYNYPRPIGSTSINPIRYAIVIAQNFQNNFSSLLIQAKDFNFTFPFNITLAVADAALLIYLILKKRVDLALFIWIILTFANARSNPVTSSETDYQSAVYIMISLFNIVLVLKILHEELKKEVEYSQKLIFSFLLIIVGIYSLFNFTFLVRKFSYKTYNKFMGFQGTVYDRPKIAPILNSLTSNADYAWIGPFAFEDLFYMNAQLPSKFVILLPAFGDAPEIQQQMIADFEKNPPKIIYFEKRYFILGRSPEMYAQFFLDYLATNYITLFDYKEGKTVYKSSIPIDDRIDLETKLYINKNDFPQVKQELLDKGLIHRE